MGNGIDTGMYWPYVNIPERGLYVWEREGWHWRKEVWMDTTHPGLPRRTRLALTFRLNRAA